MCEAASERREREEEGEETRRRHTFLEILISCGHARTLTRSLSTLSTCASSTSSTYGRNTSALYLRVNTASASNGRICDAVRRPLDEHVAQHQ